MEKKKIAIFSAHGREWTEDALHELEAITITSQTWQTSLTDEVMLGIERQQLYKTKEEMIEVLKIAQPFVIDREAGKISEEQFVRRSSKQFGLIGGWNYRRHY